METVIMIFMALLWACFAADSDVDYLRGRELTSGLCECCCHTDHGDHTLEVECTKRRFIKRQPDCENDPCPAEDYITHKSDTEIVPMCKNFNNQERCTLYVSRVFADILRDSGATPGECEGRNVGPDVHMRLSYYDGDKENSVEDKMCMDLDIDGRTSRRTVEVVYPNYNFLEDWFRDRSEYHDDGTCTSSEEDDEGSNVDHEEYCVMIEDDHGDPWWFEVDTYHDFEDFWRKNADRFKDGSCPNNIFDDYDVRTIDMRFYHDGGGGDEVIGVSCLEFDSHPLEDEFHTVEYIVDREAEDFFEDWLEHTREYVEDGSCAAKYDEDDYDDDWRDRYDGRVIMCVKLRYHGDTEWFEVDTIEAFEEFFKERSDSWDDTDCDSADSPGNYHYLEMYHYFT